MTKEALHRSRARDLARGTLNKINRRVTVERHGLIKLPKPAVNYWSGEFNPVTVLDGL